MLSQCFGIATWSYSKQQRAAHFGTTLPCSPIAHHDNPNISEISFETPRKRGSDGFHIRNASNQLFLRERLVSDQAKVAAHFLVGHGIKSA